MKKSLLAVAVAAALPAFAQAQSSVTLYGLVDAAIEYSNSNANGSGAGAGDSGLRLINGGQTQSRFGIRGVEDLGGGLKAVFTLEHRLSVDTGDTAGGNAFVLPGGSTVTSNQKFWNGQAFVGLQSGWGQITAGRQYTPIFWAILPNDFTGYLFYNNWAAYSSSSQNVGAVQGPIRLDNSVSYRSPTFGGLTVYATYAFGENLSNSAANGSAVAGSGDVWGIAAGWQLGGLYIGGGYHSFDQKVFQAATGSGLSSVNQAFEDVLVITAGYRFGSFGLSVGYSELNFIGSAAFGTSPAAETIFMSAFLNLGPGTIYLNAANVEASGFAGLRNDSGLQLGLSYLMPLSKRTSWYVTLGMNDLSGLQSTAPTTYLLDSQQRVAVGIRHNF
jgi:predicted porin